MSEVLIPSQAIAYLDEVMQKDGEASNYIAAYATSDGRNLAVSVDQKTTRIWLEVEPVGIPGVSTRRVYQASEARTSNLNAGRGARLAVGRTAVLVDVQSAEALEALVKWYGESKMTKAIHEAPICLLGTWTDFGVEDFERVNKFISDRGGWSAWWSFRVKDEAKPLLGMPFWLYVNRGGNSIVARYLVSEMATGSEPIVSPWPSITDDHLVGKTSGGSESSDVCKTWFRVTAIEMLPSNLTQADFEPVEGLSKDTSLLNQKTFGYARFKSAKPTKENAAMPSDSTCSLNAILYGPPGTSKTFETIDHALKIIDPDFFSTYSNDRIKLKGRFDDLRSQGRIEFVTFHQSYSYEDFVEGIRAWTAAGFTDTEFRCDDETGGGPWLQEGSSVVSSSLRQ